MKYSQYILHVPEILALLVFFFECFMWFWPHIYCFESFWFLRTLGGLIVLFPELESSWSFKCFHGLECFGKFQCSGCFECFDYFLSFQCLVCLRVLVLSVLSSCIFFGLLSIFLLFGILEFFDCLFGNC